MDNKDLLNGFSEIDEKYIVEYEKTAKNTIKKRKTKKYILRSLAAIVVVFALVVGGLRVYDLMMLRRIDYTPDKVLPVSVKADYPESIITFGDYSSLMAIFRKNAQKYVSLYSNSWASKSTIGTDVEDYAEDYAEDYMFAAETASDSSVSNTGAGATYSQTNLRDESADEPDLVKTDGNFIYVLSYSDDNDYYGSIVITDIRNSETPVVAGKINPYIPSEEFNGSMCSFFLCENKLIFIENLCKKYDYTYDEDEPIKEEGTTEDSFVFAQDGELWANDQYCVAVIYDVTNPDKPVMTDYYAQKGGYVDARIVDNSLILVSREYVDTYGVLEENLPANVCVPSVIQNGVEEYLPIDSIVAYDTDDSSYLNILSVNFSDTNNEPSAVSILGGGSDIYCNGEDLFIAETEYCYNENNFDFELNNDDIESDSKTIIYRFSLANSQVTFTGSGEIPGTQNGQFSMDEYNGYFRIASTVTGYIGEEYVTNSALFVLDGDLNIVGAIPTLMENEQVKGVRFMGDTAYVVTFERTDPLFVLDLSEPSNPQIIGELEITGFSEYLHPVDGGLMLGVGSDGDEYGLNGGTKVSLFDVSNPKEMSETGKITIESANLYNFTSRAFLVGNNGLYGYPVIIWHENTSDVYGYDEIYGLQTFQVVDGVLTASGFYKADTSECSWVEFVRGITVDDYLYVITTASLTVYKIGDTENPITTIEFPADITIQ